MLMKPFWWQHITVLQFHKSHFKCWNRNEIQFYLSLCTQWLAHHRCNKKLLESESIRYLFSPCSTLFTLGYFGHSDFLEKLTVPTSFIHSVVEKISKEHVLSTRHYFGTWYTWVNMHAFIAVRFRKGRKYNNKYNKKASYILCYKW